MTNLVAIESVAQRNLGLVGRVLTRHVGLKPDLHLNEHAGFEYPLTQDGKAEVVANCDHLTRLKYSRTLPYAFTEQGVLMLANELKSDRAVEVSLLVVRTFVQLREMLSTNKELEMKLLELERKVSSHDQPIVGLISNNPFGRHSGAGRNPVKENNTRSGQNKGLVPLMWGLINYLDSGLRRNDVVFSVGISGLMGAIRQLMKQPFGVSLPIGFTANIKGERQ